VGHLEPRRAVGATDPGEHYLVHACRPPSNGRSFAVRRFTSSDVYVARRMAETLRARGWAVVMVKSLPGSVGATEPPAAREPSEEPKTAL
jgi:hypothetical protein